LLCCPESFPGDAVSDLDELFNIPIGTSERLVDLLQLPNTVAEFFTFPWLTYKTAF
jgi:hypothetical protein